MLEKTNRVNRLFDFYAPLLKERQRQYLEMYYREDLSLSEIAEQIAVSRQAVYEQLKRAETILEEYEEKLALLSRYEQRRQLIVELLSLVESNADWDKEDIQGKFQDLANFELELD